MGTEIVQLSGIVGATATAVVVLRYLIQLIVVVWSLRADEAGRRHAIRLLELLRNGRRQRRRPP
ncbi:hypothetical protein KIPE111705_44705 [Kibdelosporangium persicum]|uniref:hypothetical protein n=1 Tax=Kibdelosporangium persicum TaxID=2698649 RepID=UPI00156403F6|nr:hypothetical protein [Kibdelosporangium persicum]